MDYPPRTECPVLGYAVDAIAPIAARFVLVDTEGWFWIRTVGAPRDGDPRDGELHQSTREGATFAATQSRQNSLPSMSCITRHDSLSPSAGSSCTRTAPSSTSRTHSASSTARRSSPTSPVPTCTSRCSRFLTIL